MKGFDGQFILRWMLEQGQCPRVIPNGSKIMCITSALSIRIIDSFNFFPMPLSKLPKTFGLEELAKGYFPHLLNCPSNQSYVGSFPDSDLFSPSTVSTGDRENFFLWYNCQKTNTFDFKNEMLKYCRSDVDILRRCCKIFREQFQSVTGVDPFTYVTIASACMAVYRSGHIKPKTIAMIPVQGYCNSINFSRDSIRWLDFVAHTEGHRILHTLNGTGEPKIAGYSVDGFCKETNTVYQYQGCFHHGCEICYDGDLIHPLTGTTMRSLRQKKEGVIDTLRQRGYNIIQMLEHDFVHLKKMENFQEFLLQHEVTDRLNPRDAFFGGRTNGIQLFYEGCVKYIDFTSLYPWVNKYCEYPVGHPEIITEDFRDIDSYFGLVKCKVFP
ncbi:uncharacterized protein TNCV_4870831 [Trichonephila clavipes]|nr:uncharacterized protein TNCV_4870831 [Trichonephila clavipes]